MNVVRIDDEPWFAEGDVVLSDGMFADAAGDAAFRRRLP